MLPLCKAGNISGRKGENKMDTAQNNKSDGGLNTEVKKKRKQLFE